MGSGLRERTLRREQRPVSRRPGGPQGNCVESRGHNRGRRLEPLDLELKEEAGVGCPFMRRSHWRHPKTPAGILFLKPDEQTDERKRKKGRKEIEGGKKKTNFLEALNCKRENSSSPAGRMLEGREVSPALRTSVPLRLLLMQAGHPECVVLLTASRSRCVGLWLTQGRDSEKCLRTS